MSSITSPAKLLVTGASGFVAAHVCRVALERGYDVIGTVRSKSKGDYLLDLFHNHGDHFKYVVVEDIVKPGAFDEAVKSVDAVLHTASPFHFKTEDPKDLIDPAIHGTTGILESTLKNGPNVKRIVITSSIAAIHVPKDPPYTFTEKDWNTYSVDLVEKEGKKSPGKDQYQASKTLAERAAWEFVQEKKGEINFDLVSINPSWVFGPIIHEVKGPSALNESVHLFWESINKPQSKEMLSATGFNYVDVRDVALAHIRALEIPAAGGERFTLNKASFTFQRFYDILHDAGVEDIPKGFPGCDKDTKFIYHDGSKAERVLKFKYIDTKDTVVDTLRSVRKRFPETN